MLQLYKKDNGQWIRVQTQTSNIKDLEKYVRFGSNCIPVVMYDTERKAIVQTNSTQAFWEFKDWISKKESQ